MNYTLPHSSLHYGKKKHADRRVVINTVEQVAEKIYAK